MNATFYHLFPEKTFDKWRDQSPDDFLYAIKLWRWITHRKRLKGIDDDLKTFFQRMLHLKKHLGPVLVQLPPMRQTKIGEMMARERFRLEAGIGRWHGSG